MTPLSIVVLISGWVIGAGFVARSIWLVQSRYDYDWGMIFWLVGWNFIFAGTFVPMILESP